MICDCGHKMDKIVQSNNKLFGQKFTYYVCKNCGKKIKEEGNVISNRLGK